jgi:outer membrane protein
MKNLSLVLSALSLIGVIGLATMVMNAKGNKTQAPVVQGGKTQGATMAFVNVDTLEAKYDLLKKKREEFKRKQEQMEAELQRSYGQMQSDANEIQKKAQANTLTQTEYEAANKRLMQMQQSLETRKQSLTEQLMREQEEFNNDLKKQLDSFLAEYNKTHHYDFIMSFSSAGSALLYGDKAHDITNDVIDGMNASNSQDTEKK